MTKIIKTYDPAKNKMIIAGTHDDMTFIKRVKKENIYRKNDGIGTSLDVLTQLDDSGVAILEIFIETRGLYQSWLKDWIPSKCLKIDNRHGSQLVMPINIMTKLGG